MSRSAVDRSANTSLYVRNLSYSCRPEEIRRMFGKYGAIVDVYIPLDYYTRQPRGFAYVQFEDVRDAQDALHYLNGTALHGRELEIQYAEGDRKTPTQMRGRERGSGGGGGGYYGRSPRYRRSRSGSQRRRRRSRSRSASPRYRRRRHRSPSRSGGSSRSVSRSPVRRRSRSGERRSHSRGSSRKASRSGSRD
ncbi:serine/arginine-rich splicing factor 12-like [Corticium candelabrum]|uniref:serine/arginine-rich splicing factor 12-like n=1 Tax=Corticium candelabrum TaxID=121492 RepID=UPI002E2590D7|nr:serine/arginine-rich splicing factor 12-like [Corticium candelabrum]